MTRREKSISVLNYVADSAHNGFNITCKAYNKMILFDYVEDTVPLSVQCKSYFVNCTKIANSKVKIVFFK
jgi:hypothetical protein